MAERIAEARLVRVEERVKRATDFGRRTYTLRAPHGYLTWSVKRRNEALKDDLIAVPTNVYGAQSALMLAAQLDPAFVAELIAGYRFAVSNGWRSEPATE